MLDSYQNMIHGGKRSGAGRKRGFAAIRAEEARKYISEQVANSLESIMRALIKKARAGDIRAAKELFDRAWGRSVESVRMEGGINLPIPILAGLSNSPISDVKLAEH